MQLRLLPNQPSTDIEISMKAYRTALFIYILTGSLFLLKYGLRLVAWPVILPLCILYACGVVAVCKYMIPRLPHFSCAARLFYIVLMIGVFVAAQCSLDPMTIQVDRWSAIHNFLNHLVHGIYPYAAQTHLGGYGSPFPVWQLLHLPFYWLGNVGLSFAVGVILFTHSLSLHIGWQTYQAATIGDALQDAPANHHRGIRDEPETLVEVE